MARITTYQQIKDMREAGDISDAEWLLVENCRAGESTTFNNGERPETPDVAYDIQAELLRYVILGGCDSCPVDATGVQLTGAYVTGKLDLDFAQAKGQTFLWKCRFEQGFRALQAQFQSLNLSGCHLPDLFAQNAQVVGNVFLRDGFQVESGVNLASAAIGGQLSCSEGVFLGQEGDALNADSIRVSGSVFLSEGFCAKGRVTLAAAEVGGQINCKGGRFDHPGGFALVFDRCKVTDQILLNGDMTAQGAVSMMGAQLGELVLGTCRLRCTPEKGEDPKRWALRAAGLEVVGNIRLGKGCHIHGGAQFAGAKVGGKLAVDGCRLRGVESGDAESQRPALEAGGLNARRISWKAESVKGDVHLNDATCETLNDKLEFWPEQGKLNLDGFVYEHLARVGSFRQRLAWAEQSAARDGEFSPQPLRQLSEVLRDMGHEGEARRAQLVKEKLLAADRLRRNQAELADMRERRAMAEDAAAYHAVQSRIPRLWWEVTIMPLWFGLLRTLIGYGYAPQRALIWAGAVIVVFGGFYWGVWHFGGMVPNTPVILISDAWQAILASGAANPGAAWEASLEGMHYESFAALTYAADVFIPLIDFGQQTAWAPTTATHLGTLGWVVNWLLEGFGWVVTALGAAAITGIIRRD